MNEINPLVSIVVPVYNVELYLDRCAHSVMNQTYRDLEIILVDDGSPDKCPDLCDQISTKDNRIVVIHKKNGGLSDARNCGMDRATGKYICFVDSDDYIENDMIEKAVLIAEANQTQITVWGYYLDFVNESDDLIRRKIVQVNEKHIINHQCDWKEYEIKEYLGLSGYAWNKLYRLDYLREYNCRFEKGLSLIEDNAFNKETFSNANNIMFLKDVMSHYIHRERETLGKAYYSDGFKLRRRMIDNQDTILQALGVGSEYRLKIRSNTSFYNIYAEIRIICEKVNKYIDKKKIVRELIECDYVQNILSTVEINSIKDKIFLWLCKKNLTSFLIFMMWYIIRRK